MFVFLGMFSMSMKRNKIAVIYYDDEKFPSIGHYTTIESCVLSNNFRIQKTDEMSDYIVD